MIATRPPRTSPEIRRRAELSRKEAADFIERALKCPECGFMVGAAYSDCIGHLKIKCQKCKTISILNFSYFHTERPKRRRWYSGDARRWKRKK